MAESTIDTDEQAGRLRVKLSGDWTLANLPTPISGLEARLQALAARHPVWDLQAIARIDSVGAILLWRAWGRRWPDSLNALPQQRSVLERAASIPSSTEWSPPAAASTLHKALAWSLSSGRTCDCQKSVLSQSAAGYPRILSAAELTNRNWAVTGSASQTMPLTEVTREA